MMVLSCFPVWSSFEALAYDGTPQTRAGFVINTYSLRFVNGGKHQTDVFEDYDGQQIEVNRYLWNADDSSSGHRFLFRLVYSFSGTGSVPARKIRMTVPKHVLRDRNNNVADRIQISVPKVNQASASNDFGYYEEGDSIVITNVRQISAAKNGYIEFAYEMTKTSFEYEDSEYSDLVHSELSVEKDSNTYQGSSEFFRVGANTSARVLWSHKASPETLQQEWNDEWGDKPADADSYYYLEWLVASYISATQPYTFTLSDKFEKTGCSVVGYKLQGASEYSSYNRVSNLRETGYRFDRVLTRHSKITYEPLEQYTLPNKANVTVKPYDEKDPEDKATAAAEYIYDTPIFVYPYGNWNSWEYGTTSWQEHFHYDWKVADYRLQEFKDGKYEYLDGNLKYCLYTIGMPYPRTLEENADRDDWRNYGKVPLNYTLTDENFYYLDGITTDHEEITIPDGTTPLTSEDYEIEYINFTVKINDADFNENTQRFIMTTGTYNDDDILYFDVKCNDGSEWIENVASWNMGAGTGTINSAYVDEIKRGKVTFKNGENIVNAFRVRTSNAHYRTQLWIYPFLKLKASDRVMALTQEKTQVEDKAWITNISNYHVTDAKGDTCFYKDINARDYIVGFQKETNLTKTLTSMTNDITNQNVTIGWRAEFSENFITNDGIDYVEQDSGVFYDLLPRGCELDVSSVAVMVGKTYLDDSQFTVNVTPNYNHSGQTLLTVRLKEPFSNAQLTYSTLYTWEDIVDYGYKLLNSVAYETGNDNLTDGLPDDGGTITNHELMTDLDPDTDDEKFCYTEHAAYVNVTRSAVLGLTKSVKNPEESAYTPETTVKQNGEYTYRLRFASGYDSYTRNMVLFDSLENYSEEGLTGDFHGLLQDVDVRQMREAGAEPVVYYSRVPSLDINRYRTVNMAGYDLTSDTVAGEQVWYTEQEFGEISEATAVAIDIRKTSEGEDFVLSPTRSVVALLRMKAPSRDTGHNAAPKAYNNIYLSDTVLTRTLIHEETEESPAEYDETEEDFFIFQNYTTVQYRIQSDLKLEKYDAQDPDTPVKGVEFTLTGVSDYGKDYNVSKLTDVNGKVTFADIEKGSYTLAETQGNADYQLKQDTLSVVVDEYGDIWIDGHKTDTTAYYRITDEPRAHTDIQFFKRDLVTTSRLLTGVRFKLSGTSDYGNTISEYATSQYGIVTFENIEKGTYELVEVASIDHYLPSKTVYKVTVDEAGVFTIKVDTTKGDGDLESLVKNDKGQYSIYNEPLHSFSIYKIGYRFGIPVEGVIFQLEGTSDEGTYYSVRLTTPQSGRVTFSDLEKGTYVLKELYAPEGYYLDDTPRVVTIDRMGNSSISGIEKDADGYFRITNKEGGTITVIKKWIDKDDSKRYTQASSSDNNSSGNNGSNTGGNTRSAAPGDTSGASSGGSRSASAKSSGSTAVRSGDGRTPIYPDITVTTEIPMPYAVFDGVTQNSILSKVTTVTDIISFGPGTQEEAAAQISNNTAVRIDDKTTEYKIYAWFNSSTGAIKWWSDAHRVYLSDSSSLLFFGLKNCTSIDVTGIDTSRLTTMYAMFGNNQKLKTLDLSSFDTTNVTNFSRMFQQCYELESVDLSSFDTSKGTDFSRMFYKCNAIKSLSLSNFDTSHTTNMQAMFRDCYALQYLDISSFTAPLCTDMSYMFYYCTSLKTLDLTNIQPSSVTDMNHMFSYSTFETVNMSGLDLSSLENFSYAFYGCSEMKQIYLNNVNAANLKSLYCSFYNMNKLEILDLHKFVAPNVTDMTYTFAYAHSLRELDLGDIDTSHVTTMWSLFFECKSLTHLDVSNFNTKNCTNMRSMFNHCESLEEVDVSAFDTSNVTTMWYMFQACTSLKKLNLSNFDTSNVTTMRQMFEYDTALEELDISSFDTSNVTDMSYMFHDCSSLKQLDVSNFDTFRVENFTNMFYNCKTLTALDVSGFYTPHATVMSGMFLKCEKVGALDVGNFNTKNVTAMQSMFSECKALKVLDLRNFEVENVTNFTGMFYYCENLTELDVSSFHTVSAKTINWMFGYLRSNTVLDLTGFVLTNVTDSDHMFYNNSSLITIYASTLWDASGITNSTEMFTGCTSLQGGVNTTFDYNYRDKTYARIDQTNVPGYLTGSTPIYPTTPSPDPEPRMENYTYLGGLDDDTSILSRIGDTSQIKAFAPYHGANPTEEEAAVQELIDAGKTVRIDKNTAYQYPIYAWLDDNGTLFYWTKAHNVYMDDTARYIWHNLTECISIDASGINTSLVTNMSRMFDGNEKMESVDLSGFNTGAVTDMSYMFNNCSALKSVDVRSFATEPLTDTNHMFNNCASLKELNITFYIGVVTDMSYMFNGCSQLETLKLSSRGVATNLSHFLSGCTSLVNVPEINTKNATDISYLFDGCESMENVQLFFFNTAAVNNMQALFRNCKSIRNLNINRFDFALVTNLSEMFSGCELLETLDMSGLAPANAQNMSRMFADCPELKTIFASEEWTTASVTSSDDMFTGCVNLVGGNGTAFDSAVIDKTYALIDKEGQKGYLTDKIYHRPGSGTYVNTITTECDFEEIDENTWSFTFSGLDPTLIYYSWEGDYEGYISSNPIDNYATFSGGSVTITNTSTDPPPDPEYGSILIEKTVTGNEVTSEDLHRSFLFTLTLKDENDDELTGTAIYGGLAFNNGVAKFRLEHGETRTIEGIPAGYHYSVVEEASDGFESSINSPTGVIVKDNQINVSCVNTKTFTDGDNTSFRLAKVVDGNYEKDDEQFTFAVSLQGLRRNNTYSVYTEKKDGTSSLNNISADSNGNAAFELLLGNGDYAEVRNIPIGSTYQVTEAAGDYISSYEITDSADTDQILQNKGANSKPKLSLSTQREQADADEEILITFTNTKDVREDITLKKIKENTADNNNDKFTFHVDIIGLKAGEVVSTSTLGRFRANDAGRINTDIRLGADEEVIFYQLPVGAKYQITELANDYTASYTVTDAQNLGMIAKSADHNDSSNTDLATDLETVNEGEEILVLFRNVKQNSDLTIAKQLDMSASPGMFDQYRNKLFSFTVELSGLESAGIYQVDYTEKDATGVIKTETITSSQAGTATLTISLSHGQLCTLRNLPVNTVYRITEEASDPFIASYKVIGNDGAVIANEEDANTDMNTSLSTASEKVDSSDLDVRVTFTNKFVNKPYVLPDAGTEDMRLILTMIFGGMILFAAAFMYLQKKNTRI